MPSWKKLITSGSDANLNSLYVNNSVTASVFSGSFVGDGSGLKNVTVDIGDLASISQPFSNVDTVTIIHLLDTDYPLVQVYNDVDEQIIPTKVKVIDSTTIRVDFTENVSGHIVVAKGGHLISGSAANSLLLDGQSSTYYLDYTNFTNIPQGIVSSSSQLTSSYDERYILSGSIAQTTWENIDGKPSNLVSSSQDSSTIDFTITNGVISADVIGGIVSASSQIDATQTTNFSTGVKDELNSNTVISSSAQIVNALPQGTVSGSSQIKLEDISGSTFANQSYTFPTDLTVQGTLTAEVYNTVFVSSSVIFQSGSTKFGDSEDDTHQFTGSVSIDGSITLNGEPIGTGKLDETTFNTYTQSVDGRLDSLEVESGSVRGELNTYTQSANLRLNSLETESGSIRSTVNTYTSSTDGRLSNIETTTSSLNSSISNLNSFTQSTDLRLQSLETESGSIRSTFNSYTSSNDTLNNGQDNRLTSLEAESGSIRTEFNTFTQSVDTEQSAQNNRLSLLETESGSIRTNFNSFTQSADSRLDELESFSSSLDTTFATDLELQQLETSLQSDINTRLLTSSFNEYTSSTDNRLGLLETESGSIRSTVNNYTSSTDNRISLLESESGSVRTELNTYTSSTDNRLTNVENFTSSQSELNQTFATTGSNIFSGNQTINGDLIIDGDLTAKNFYIDSASVIYTSGSTKFGDTSDDIHEFTGSVKITGSISLNGEPIGTGKLDETTFNTYTQSISEEQNGQNNRLTSLETESGSVRTELNSFTQSANNRLSEIENTTSSLNSSVSNLNTYTQSADLRLQSLETESGSVRTELNTYTQSTDSRLGLLETESGSIRTEFNSFTQSVNTEQNGQNNRLTSLETESGSIRSTFNTYTSSTDGRLVDLESFSSSLDLTFATDLELQQLETTLQNDIDTRVLTSSFNSYTQSADLRLNSLETESGSVRTELNTYTQSNDLRLQSIETESGSIRTELNTYTSSADLRLQSLETESGSVRTELNSFTQSADNRLISLESESGSVRTELNNYTSSTDGKLSNIENFTSSQNTLNQTFATTGSNTFYGNQSINGDLVVSGDLTAKNFYIDSSSVIYTSGSTKFGDTPDDTHEFTGSVKITGSIELNGLPIGTGKLDETVFNSYTQSINTEQSEQNNRLSTLETESGSIRTTVNNYTSSNDNRVQSLETESGSIRTTVNTYTSSTDNRLSLLETESGSIRTELNTYTQSADNRLDGLEMESGSIRTEFNSYTQSINEEQTEQNNRLTSLETESGSIRGDFNQFTSSYNTGSFTGSFIGDGSGLTNVIVQIGDLTSFSQPFTDTNTVTVNHLLSTLYPLVQVYNDSDEQIVPTVIKVLNDSSIRVDFTENVSGHIVVAKGGHIVSGSAANSFLLDNQEGSYYLDYTNFTNVPGGIVSSSSQLTSSYDERYILSGSIAQTTWENIDGKPSNLVSSSQDSSTIDFTITDGVITATVIGGVVSGSSQVDITNTNGFSTFSSSISSINETQNGRLSNLESFTSSQSSLNQTFATTGSNVFEGNQTINGNLIIDGDLTAKNFYIDSSSIIYTSGSTKFGDTEDDTHQFTGSVDISGSIFLNGQAIGTGKLDEVVFNSYTQSNDNRVSLLETESGSIRSTVNNYTSSTDLRIQSLETESGSIRTEFNSYTSSNDTLNNGQNNRLSLLETESGSIRTELNSYTQSTNNRLNEIELTTASLNSTASNLNTFTQSADLRLDSIETESGSIRIEFNTFTQSVNTEQNGQNNRLSLLETESGSVRTELNTYTQSVNNRLDGLSTESGSIRTTFNSYTSSTDNRLSGLESFSSSLDLTFATDAELSSLQTLLENNINTRLLTSSFDNYTNDTNNRLGGLETESGSIRSTLNTYTSSTDSRLNEIQLTTSSLNSSVNSINNFTQSADNRLSLLETESGSIRTTLNTYTQSADSRFNSLETESGSVRTELNNYSSSTNSRLQSIETESGSIRSTFNSYTSSTDSRLNLIEQSTSSLESSVSNLNSYTQSTDFRLQSIETESGSIRSTFNSYTSSTDTRVSDLESYSSSLKSAIEITGSNITVLGNLEVKGTTTTIDSTTIQLGDNIIELNGSGAANGGIYVRDTTAPNEITGSLLWNSTTDRWIAGQLNSESNILLANGDSIVSSSSQIDITNTTGFSTFSSSLNTTTVEQNNRLSSLETESGSIRLSVNTYTSSTDLRLQSLETESGSVRTELNTYTQSADNRLTNIESFTSSIDTTIKTKLDSDGVISGSSQLTSSYDGRYELRGSGILSGSFKDKLDSEGVISGSSQVQIDNVDGFTTYSSSVDSRLVSLETESGSIRIDFNQFTSSYNTGSFTGSFVGDGSGLTNIVVDIDELTATAQTFTNTTTVTVNHLLSTLYPIIQVYNDNNEQIVPTTIKILDSSSIRVDFTENVSGYVVVAKGGHIISGSAANSVLFDNQPSSYYLDYTNFTNVPSGLVSGSSQIRSLTYYKEEVSGSSSYTITHNLGELHPIVQVYDTENEQVIPLKIKSNSEIQVLVTFPTEFSGSIVIKS